jgi:hypothetical protein
LSRVSDEPAALARISLDAIRHNTRLLRRRAGHADVMAVVKADGYGHGAVPVARAALAAGATQQRAPEPFAPPGETDEPVAVGDEVGPGHAGWASASAGDFATAPSGAPGPAEPGIHRRVETEPSPKALHSEAEVLHQAITLCSPIIYAWRTHDSPQGAT